jgi:hypothetical protein
MTSSWATPDLDIVETLTRRVRLLSIRQIARIWWPQAGSLRVVRRRLRRVAQSGLLARAIVNVHPLLNLSQPLARWTPGGEVPDFQEVSLQARSRWQSASTPQEIFSATRLAANLYGSSAGALPDLTHRDHDLLLGQVYVIYRKAGSAEVCDWVGEDALPKAGYRIKDPDAFLVDSDGNMTRVIESAGRYSFRQVESFHEHCVEHGLPYELW